MPEDSADHNAETPQKDGKFLRVDGGHGHTWGVWECPDCGVEVQSDNTTNGLDCPECGATVVSR